MMEFHEIKVIEVNSITCQAILGITPGYNHNNNSADAVNTSIADRIMKIVDEEFATGEYFNHISFSIYPTTVVYNREWGCPVGGEKCYILEAVANPKFVSDMRAWKQDCLRYIKHFKEYYKQSTVTVRFQECEVHYLT